MLETITHRLATERGIDDDLKACDMLRWGAEMNNVKASAEEAIFEYAFRLGARLTIKMYKD